MSGPPACPRGHGASPAFSFGPICHSPPEPSGSTEGSGKLILNAICPSPSLTPHESWRDVPRGIRETGRTSPSGLVVHPLSLMTSSALSPHQMHISQVFAIIFHPHVWIQFLERTACHLCSTPGLRGHVLPRSTHGSRWDEGRASQLSNGEI